MRASALLLALFLPSGRADAADVKVSGLVFAQYEAVTSKYLANGTRADGRNSFDIGRVYLNAAAPLSERLDSFMQLEANLLSRDNTANSVFIKQANLTYKELYPGAKLTFGMIQTAWVPFEESMWKHRFVARILLDEEGLQGSADRGVRLSGSVPYIAYELMVANGEGVGGRSTAGNEPNKSKDVSVRLSFYPFSAGSLGGLKLHAFGSNGQKFEGWARDRAIGGLSYERGRFSAMASYIVARDGSGAVLGSTSTAHGAGFSVHTTVPLASKCWVFARYDQWDPDTSTGDNARSRVIGGFGHQLAETVRIALDYQALVQQKQAAARRDQGLASLHLEAKF